MVSAAKNQSENKRASTLEQHRARLLKILPELPSTPNPLFWLRVPLTDHFGLNLYSIWIACRWVDLMSVDGYADAEIPS
jgi:hypothetical protein